MLLIFSVKKFSMVVQQSQAPRILKVSPLTETTVNGIPLIIHQIFVHAYRDHVPLKWINAQKSWIEQSVRYQQQRLYNEFIYILWTDDTIDRFVREQYPWFYQTFRTYKLPISKTDAVRYLLLHHYGGIYSDLDVESTNKSIRLILSSFDKEGVGLMETTPFGFANDFIIAAKGHPFLKYVISGLISAQITYPFPYMTEMASAGPLYITAKYALYKQRSEIRIFNKDIYGKKYFKHYGGSSWHSWDGRIIWYLYNFGLINFDMILKCGLIIIVCIILVLKHRNKSRRCTK